VKRRHRFYVPLKLRVALTFLAGALWFCFSLWLSRGWIGTLGQDISMPLAILLFYFFCYQFVMSPISLAGYSLEAVRARRAW
jgi:hypothetical protein